MDKSLPNRVWLPSSDLLYPLQRKRVVPKGFLQEQLIYLRRTRSDRALMTQRQLTQFCQVLSLRFINLPTFRLFAAGCQFKTTLWQLVGFHRVSIQSNFSVSQNRYKSSVLQTLSYLKLFLVQVKLPCRWNCRKVNLETRFVAFGRYSQFVMH